MVESMQDLIGVLLGLVVLWFLFGALIRQERLWEGRHAGRQRNRLSGR